MPVSVIGAGFGRTGTLSLKLALERLGVGPCHHMLEVVAHPAQAAGWHAAADGGPADWDALLAGYEAAVDWPAAHFWRPLMAHYPEAKIILTFRDAESWQRSFAATIATVMEDTGDVVALARRIVERTFDGRLDDADHLKDVFRRHVQEVMAEVPPKRLLLYKIAGGWAPLCKFLGKPVPTEPFPRVNTTEEFLQKAANLRGES